MKNIYTKEDKECDYRPTRFLQVMRVKAVRLIRRGSIIQEKCKELFTAGEIQKCKNIFRVYNYIK